MVNFKSFENTKLPIDSENLNKPNKPKETRLLKKAGIASSALALLLSVDGGLALAEDKKNLSENDDKKYELMVKNNGLTETEIIKKAKEIGRAGRMNQTPTKKLDLPDGSAIIIGYNDKNEAKWLMHEDANGSFTMIDYNPGSGKAGRIITNDEEGNSNHKKALNHLDAFSNTDFLATEARMHLKSEKVQIYSLQHNKDGEDYILIIDRETGETTKSDDPIEFKKYNERIQRLYGVKLKNASSQIR